MGSPAGRGAPKSGRPSSPDQVNFYIFPCYGSLNWQLGYNEVPVPGNPDNICNIVWQEGSTDFYCRYFKPMNGSKFYISIQGGFADSNAFDASAIVDVYYYSGTFDVRDTLVPHPGNNGELVATPEIKKLKKGQKQTIDLSWAGTGNSNDTYTVYTHVGTLDGTGALTQTGCGVRTVLNPSNVSITQPQTNRFAATLAGVDPKQDLVFNIVVERQGGYSNAYIATTYNGGALISVSPAMFLLLLIVAFFAN